MALLSRTSSGITLRVAASDADTKASDAELAQRVSSAAAGQAAQAEAELCHRFAPRVRLYGLKHLRSEDEAVELVQRTLEITLRKLRQGAVQQPARIASFVLGVARLQSLEIRRGAEREALLDTDAEAVLVAPPREPETLALAQLSECLNTLEERERSVIALSYYSEQSAPEIAEFLHTTAGNVRVIRTRVIERLRRCMGLLEELA